MSQIGIINELSSQFCIEESEGDLLWTLYINTRTES